jgi:DNA polymerase-3 subunit epsilon
MTAKLWLAMLDYIERQYRIDSIPFALIQKLARTPKKAVCRFLEQR